MKKENRIDLTNMVMVYRDDGKILVQLREKKDWPGLNFPGGHVEDNETVLDSAIREIREETGLNIRNLESCGYFEWNLPQDNIRYISLLYRTKDFSGELKDSLEGKVFWINISEVNNYPLSTDFDKLLLLMLKGIDIE